ncbi:hypothetical protein B7486_30305 [cyanobacterium TDX16]|nr:hypothetical protein B7486_30305 [cyanobacterium TDX16]
MAFFTDLTASLKQKWVQFFHANHAWIAKQMEIEYVTTPDGGRRPSSNLILGVVSALEPQLAELMIPFTKLNPDLNALIDVLELNFDPEKMQSDRPHNPMGNRHPHNPDTQNSDAQMDALMGMMDDHAESALDALSTGDVPPTTMQATGQTSDVKKNFSQSDFGDVWADEQSASSNRPREGKTGDDEISRLFPEF